MCACRVLGGLYGRRSLRRVDDRGVILSGEGTSSEDIGKMQIEIKRTDGDDAKTVPPDGIVKHQAINLIQIPEMSRLMCPDSSFVCCMYLALRPHVVSFSMLFVESQALTDVETSNSSAGDATA